MSTSQKVPLTHRHGNNNKNASLAQDAYVTFDVGSRYKLLETIGTGAYGVVCSAIDEKTKNHVAIKKIVNPFDVLTTAKRTLRELKLLLHFKHDNIVAIKNIIQSENKDCREVYFVMDLMETDLHHIIRSDQGLTAEHVCYFLYQILRGLKYIHSANVIHRDLKPSNLLVNENCELKIGDFGMARGVASHPEDQKLFMTEYVATRWYRAPELMLSVGSYSQSIDMWSVGCIFAEMMGRKQIFPGRHYVHQLQLVISILGSPDSDLVKSIRSDRVRGYIQSLPHKEPVLLASLYPKASLKMIELLSNLLRFDPLKRPTASEALKHAFITNYHDNDDEPLCPVPFDFQFETKVTKDEVLTQVTKIIKNYHNRKNKLSTQLKVVSQKASTISSTSDDVFKKPQAPPGGQKVAMRMPEKETNHNDIDMKSANSVSSMDFGAEMDKTVIKPHKVDDKTPSSSGKQEKTIITVHVVQDDHDDDAKSEKTVEKVKPPAKSKNKDTEKRASGSKKSSGPKKSTISEDTKLKLRDSVFAKMLAKQKGLGKPLDKVKKPVTAADRQREREEKRRKRQERAAEKEKKKKEVEEAQSKKELSDADKSLLQRWTNMQKKGKHVTESDKSPPKSDDQAVKKLLSRHKSLPSNSTNSYKQKLQNDLVVQKRWSATDNQNSTASGGQTPDVFTVVIGDSKPVSSTDNLGDVTKDKTIEMNSFSEMSENLQRPQSLEAVKSSSVPLATGFIPEPNYHQHQEHGTKHQEFVGTKQSNSDSHISKFGGIFIPETEMCNSVPTTITTRPTGLFSPNENISVFVNDQVMTPGKASMQNSVTTPSGKNLVTLSPDTVDFVLGGDMNQTSTHPHLVVDSVKSSSSQDGALTFSPGGTSLVFKTKQPKPETSSLFNSNESNMQSSLANLPNPSYDTGTSISESNHLFPANPAYFNVDKSQSNPSNGGMFVPNLDEAASLNAHHYGPLKQTEVLPQSRAADATGEGYGLGVNIDDIIPQSAVGEAPLSAMDFSVGLDDPCSSSLLSDWLDMRCLHPEDMEALQKELELGSPMSVDG